MPNNLQTLRDRLAHLQREIIVAAADADTIPSDNSLRKIADLEVTIAAIEALLESS